MTSSRVSSSSAMDVSVVADAASQFQLILETDAAGSTCRISNVHLLSLQLPVTSVCELCWKCTKSDKTLQPSVPNIVCLWCECNLHRGQMAVFWQPMDLDILCCKITKMFGGVTRHKFYFVLGMSKLALLHLLDAVRKIFAIQFYTW